MRIVVLRDGETWSVLERCKILDLPDGLDADQIEEHIDNVGGFDAGYTSDEGSVLYQFSGDDERAYSKPAISERIALMDAFELRMEVERIIGEDKCDSETLRELVAQFGGDKS